MISKSIPDPNVKLYLLVWSHNPMGYNENVVFTLGR